MLAKGNQGSSTIGGHIQPTQEIYLEHPARVSRETAPLGSTGHLCKVILLRLKYIAALPNTEKQTQKSSQNRDTNKHVPIERTEQNSRKTTKQNGDKQSTRLRVKNIGYKMLNEFSENFNKEVRNIKKEIESIHKDQLEIQDTIAEVNNIRGNQQ